LAEAAAPSDSVLFLGAVYKYTYLLTYLLTCTSCKFYNNPFTVGSKIMAVE